MFIKNWKKLVAIHGNKNLFQNGGTEMMAVVVEQFEQNNCYVCLEITRRNDKDVYVASFYQKHDGKYGYPINQMTSMFQDFIGFLCNEGIIEDEDGELDDRLEEFLSQIPID